MPVLGAGGGTVHDASIDADVAITVDLAGFDHGGEEYPASDAASIDRRTSDGSNLQQRFLAVEAVDVIRFEGSVGRKVETVFGRNGRDRAGLLPALQHGLDAAEIAGGAQDAAFVAVIAGQHPEAIRPGIVDDVVDVTNCALGECIGDAPGSTGVSGSVDVDFMASGVVEILSPIDCAARYASGNDGDVQRAGAAEDRVSAAKFGFAGRFAGRKRDDRSRDGGDESAGRQSSKRVKTVAEQASREAVRDRQTAAQCWVEPGYGLPGHSIRRFVNSGSEQLVATRRIEMIARPRQRPQMGETCDTKQAVRSI